MERENILSGAEAFIEKHSKALLWGVGGVAAVVGLTLAAGSLYFAPRDARAANELFRAEALFRVDSFRLALEGNGSDIPGFAATADAYGSAPAGNLAQAYAGICAFRLGDYSRAVDYLKAFDAPDDAVLRPVVTALTGDCYVNLGETEKAIPYFEKAAKIAGSDLLSPTYLKKAGAAYEALGQYAKAAKVYRHIRERYYTSTEAGEIEKYIVRAEELAKAAKH
ncbi:MAG: tetratricopeptide repeat protein [Tannerellaceae bacterium]|jgi:tetratricopeptide (TPR) repeat protein|nr:tetratricopeptide repeat protein [Tannerellaceae bacterium]